MEGAGLQLKRRLGRFGRRPLLGLAALGLWPRTALAFGQEGAFHARALSVGGGTLPEPRYTALARWSWELVRRTSAPGRLVPAVIAADDPALLFEPFAVWSGARAPAPLSIPEIRGLRRFLKLGGVLLVDDSEPSDGAFGRAARRELSRVLAEAPVVPLPKKHVLYKSYYLVDRPVGRIAGKPELDALARGKTVQVIFSDHDLLGALARQPGGSWSFVTEPGGDLQRQEAIRLAVNIAMYVLCSDYKDDQVHAQELMRRRGRRQR